MRKPSVPDPMRPRQFDLIAFDWDGTLFDSTALITRCIQSAVVDVGGVAPTREAASYVIGMGLMQALAHAAPSPASAHAASRCAAGRTHSPRASQHPPRHRDAHPPATAR